MGTLERYAQARAVDQACASAITAELADEHDCWHEVDGAEYLGPLGCGDCAARAMRLVARLRHEGLLVGQVER